jgi:hypothetical protein
MLIDISSLPKVSIEQFYGIEIEDFPCQIAQVGLWLGDHIDWESVVPKQELSYILGNPPCVGYSNRSKEQKADILSVYHNSDGKPYKTAGKIDYVAAWHYKAAQYLTGTQIRAAFVSTNSITQGEQVAFVWKPLFEMFGIHIDFAYRTFKWSNNAPKKAALHCVIVGFSIEYGGEKVIYDGDKRLTASNINPYLVDAPSIIVESRTTPLCDVLSIGIGNQPIDGGNYLFTENKKEEFLNKEPHAGKWFHPWIGADEFINGYRRYCLWLGDCPPSELRSMPEVMKRVKAVRQLRINSKSAPTRKLADTPCRFHVENMPKSDYIVIPATSSERRRYIPIGFVTKNTIASNAVLIIPNATLYHFGILTS